MSTLLTFDYRVLIVDDVESNLYALRTLIRRYLPRVEVLEANTGILALEMALKMGSLDIIILDVQMPEMDGFQTASMLKIRKKTRDIPIIFLTAAFKTTEFQRRGYQVGAVDYLLKPIDDHQLISKIGTYLRLIEKERHLNRELEQRVQERTEQLFRAKRYLENIITYMGEALLVLGPDGIIRSANPAAYSMLDYQDGALEGMSIGDVFLEEDQTKANAFMGTWLEALIRSGVCPNVEASFIAQDGHRVPVLFSRSAMTDETGKITDIICIAKDMTEYAEIKAALQE